MILQALTQYYEALSSSHPDEIAPYGWGKAKVSYALELDGQGQILALLPLQNEVQRGKKSVTVPREEFVPAPVKRSVGILPNFLCDNSSYILGADNKGKPQRTLECFAAAKELHLSLLKDTQSPAACAVRSFFEHWQPEQAASHPTLQQDWDGLTAGGNLIFRFDGQFVMQDAELRQIWQRAYASRGEGSEAVCLVTGQRSPIERLHPNIKGVAGAQSSGASLVSFNAASFCSYGHEQGGNSPVSEYAAFAYTTALNHLLADSNRVHRIGDTTVVCWAANAEPAYTDFVSMSLFGDAPYQENDILSVLHKLAMGNAFDWQESRLDPNMRFYVLGLAPNTARLSVRFFWQNSFGIFARNVARHYERLKIVRPSFDNLPTLSVRQLLRETVNPNARNPEPSPRLAGDLFQAILSDELYPATLINGIELRIRADREVNRTRVAIIKAYYLRNSQSSSFKEVFTVELNEQSTYQPYVLGRLFAVLEAIQDAANPNINTTIKDRYFNSASATPEAVFPTLINLTQKHLAKLKDSQKIYYNKKITELMSLISETYPTQMTLEQQGAFQIGYYHETQKRYAKKEETENV